MFGRKKKRTPMQWEKAPDIEEHIRKLIVGLNFVHVDAERIFCFRSFGSVARARARIWSMPTIWQLALNIKAHYVIEVISEKFDHLSETDRLHVLIHELMHIPKTFSGALVPHRGRFHAINHHSVEKLFNEYMKAGK